MLLVKLYLEKIKNTKRENITVEDVEMNIPYSRAIKGVNIIAFITKLLASEKINKWPKFHQITYASKKKVKQSPLSEIYYLINHVVF